MSTFGAFKFTPDQIRAAHAMHPESTRAAAKSINMNRSAYVERLEKMREAGELGQASFSVAEEPPSTDEPISDLIARRRANGKRVAERVKYGDWHKVAVADAGPVGILHMGDWHLDDDGTDFDLFCHHVDLVVNTPGLFCGLIGDLQNNWIGRLSRLWAAQNVGAANAWRLVEHYIKALGPKLLYLVPGNHDAWSGTGDPLRWIMANQPGVMNHHDVRIEFSFPAGESIRMHARHQWPGRSQFDPGFGGKKAVYRGNQADLLIGGHTHNSAGGWVYNDNTGSVGHYVQVGSYKRIDDYALAGGFPNDNLCAAVVTVHEPWELDPFRRSQVFYSVEAGLTQLVALRSRRQK